MTITVAEILDALAKAAVANDPDVPPYTYTGTELRAAMEWSGPTFSRTIGGMIAAGDVTLCKIRRRAIDGRLATITAYQFRR